ncbi:MAG: family 43 glycosylhydrolase [Clostridia bacterium]|nr:family 43 glycosylhydrolase [Clostridia bacterium]
MTERTATTEAKKPARAKKFLFTLILCVLTAALALPAFAYNNPIPLTDLSRKEFSAGDPFVMKYNGVYYCYVSGGNSFRSTDLLRWTYVGNVFQGDHSHNLYAPEVFYWNGAFYCISCPDGTTNYRFKSDSPEGPFTAVSGDLGGGIDGSLFRDDDGAIYFTHAAFNGIALYRMETPESEMVPLGKIPVSVSGMWTEGPGIFKRNGKYYMTFCGNDVLDPSYRSEYAVSDRVDSGWKEPEQNVLLLSTDGALTGLGHNSVVIGPDLDTYYIVYHNRYPDYSKDIDRAMNIQPILWSGDRPVVASGEVSGTDPALPAEEYRPENGTEPLSGQKLLETPTEDIFTAEFNLVPAVTDVLFGYIDERNFCALRFENNTAVLETVTDGNAVETRADVPKNTDLNVLQCVGVRQSESALSVTLAGGTLFETTPSARGGKIGYRAQKGTVGYTAFSGTVLGNRDNESVKYANHTYPATLFNEAVGGKTVSAKEPGNALLLAEGEKATYALSSFYGEATLTLRGKATENTRLNVYIDGDVLYGKVAFAESGGYRTEILRHIPMLKGGEHNITVEVLSGSFEFYEFATCREDELMENSYNMDRSIPSMGQREGEGEYIDGEFALTAKESLHGDCFGKTILGFLGSTDYSVEARVRLESIENGAEAGLFVRSVNETNGKASGFSFRRKWYQRCYYACLKSGAVCLYRQDYGEKLLAEYPTAADMTEPHMLKVIAQGCDLTVLFDGEEVIRYTDEYYPFPYGRYGFKAANGKAYYDDLTVEEVAWEFAAQETGEETADPNGDATAPAPALLWVIIPAAAVVLIILLVLFVFKRKKGAPGGAEPENKKE